MATEWYCRIMGQEMGPLSFDELIAVARWGRLSRNDTVRSGVNGNWVRAELVSGLFDTNSNASKLRPICGGRPPGGKPGKADRAERHSRTVLVSNRSEESSAHSPPGSSSSWPNMACCGVSISVSNDRRHWTRASLVRGLVFSGLDGTLNTMSIRSAVVLDEPLDWNNMPSVDAAPIAAEP